MCVDAKNQCGFTCVRRQIVSPSCIRNIRYWSACVATNTSKNIRIFSAFVQTLLFSFSHSFSLSLCFFFSVYFNLFIPFVKCNAIEFTMLCFFSVFHEFNTFVIFASSICHLQYNHLKDVYV